MDYIEDSTKSRQGKGLRFRPLQTPIHTLTHQEIDHLPPAADFADEEPYGNIFQEELQPIQNKHLSNNLHMKDRSVKRRSSLFGLAVFLNRSRPMNMKERQDRLGTQWEEDAIGETAAVKGDNVSHLPADATLSAEINALPAIDSPANPLRHKTSKPNLKAKQSSRKEVTAKKTATWDPPPLFQAYPQAIKHATLRAPCLSAEAILRLHANRNPSTDSNTDQNKRDSSKTLGERRLKRHTGADVLSKGEWTHKMFMLVTSGYLLQYAGEGNFDRLPEKIMPLTTESAAFASDAIPGQPYVLQVSQVSDDQGTLDKEASRSMLKKLGLRNEMRRSTSTFLLVLDAPEEMSTWLIAVRREILAMSGKEYMENETQIRNTEEPVESLQQRPSQRFLVRRHPNRFSDKTGDADFGVNERKGHCAKVEAKENVALPLPPVSNRLSLATQSSTVSRSVSNTTSSINQVYLDRLRESPRESYASTGAKTASTSRGSSLERCPDDGKFELPDLTREFAESRSPHSVYPRAARKSMYGQGKVNAAHRESLRASPASSAVQQSDVHTPKHRRTPSPAAPNFSVPTSSKRYSIANSFTGSSCPISKTQTPPITLHEPPSPPMAFEEANFTEQQNIIIRERQHLGKPRMGGARKSRGIEKHAILTPPRSSGSHNPPSSSDAEKSFSRRFSSLEYSRRLSLIQLAGQSPSPHPPPTSALPALPALPKTHQLYPASICSPPTMGLPPIPTTTPPTLPVVAPSSSPSITPAPPKICPDRSESQPNSKHSSADAPAIASKPTSDKGALNRPPLTYKTAEGPAKTKILPTNLQVRDDAITRQTLPATPYMGFKTAFEVEGLTPHLNESPPKPTRDPPPPPSENRVQESRSRSGIGREPPPVYLPPTSPKPRISVSSRAESYFESPAPPPFIPPIRVSERKFRGSLDGPWNASYDAPQMRFLNLSIS